MLTTPELFAFVSPAPSLPRKGTETYPLEKVAAREKRQVGPAPSLPRKGTETRLLNGCVVICGLSPAPSLPRKGTETLMKLGQHVLSFVSRTLLTPQGDGND